MLIHISFVLLLLVIVYRFFFNSTLSPKIKSIIKYSHAQSPLLYICFKLRNVAALIQNKRERFENIYKMQHTHATEISPKNSESTSHYGGGPANGALLNISNHRPEAGGRAANEELFGRHKIERKIIKKKIDKKKVFCFSLGARTAHFI